MRLSLIELGDAVPPTPLGFFALTLLQQKEDKNGAGQLPGKTTRPFCCWQPPDGARVASPQSPILR